jgi:hypothetical protein
MERKIYIKAGNVELEAVLNDSETAGLVFDALPIEGRVNTWGDEIYFDIPVSASLENPKDVVECGEIGYWPTGQAFCIFFGPTPASEEDEIRPASSVTPIGWVLGDVKRLRSVVNGDKIMIKRRNSD